MLASIFALSLAQFSSVLVAVVNSPQITRSRVSIGKAGQATNFARDRKGITLQTADDKTVDVQLEVGATSQSVDVTAGAPLIDTTTDEAPPQCAATSAFFPRARRSSSSNGSTSTKTTAMNRNVSRNDSIIACRSTMP